MLPASVAAEEEVVEVEVLLGLQAVDGQLP